MKIKCPLCGLENDEGSKFCKNCNEPLHLYFFCPYCGELLQEKPNRKKKCNSCGKYIYIQDDKLITEEKYNIIKNEKNKNIKNAKKETEGQKIKRLNVEFDILLKKPNTSLNKIKKFENRIRNLENNFVNRNLTGNQLEKEGKINEAITLYEKNIEEEFDGSYPFRRLAIIYRKKGLIEEEVRVLKRAIWIFENVVYIERSDRLPKLEEFKKRLEKINKKRL